jgi:EmrB/QacA subfamily drug resistance transporter
VIRRPHLGLPALEQRWIFFGVAALSLLMSSIDGTIVAVALPTFIRDLNANLVWAGWTLTAYALTQTVMVALAGKLGEQFGQMRVCLACVCLFTFGSLLSGLAPNIYVLIACRVLQAIGGGSFFPVATGIVAQQFPKTRNRMIGLFASIFPIGAILGPNIGGFVIEQFGWRQVFFINIPIGMLVIAVLAKQAFRETPTVPTSRRRIDVTGAALFAATVVGFLLALTLVGNNPSLISSPLVWLMIGGSGVLLGLFVWQERRATDPIIDLSLVGRQPFLVVNVVSMLNGVCFMGFFSFIPFYATVQYGMGPMESGAILTPRSLVMIAASTTMSFLLPRLGYRNPMLVGTLCVTATLLVLGQGPLGLTLGPVAISPVVPLLLVMALSGLGMGLLIPSSNNAGLDLLPGRAAVISGLRGLFNSIGGVIGTAVIVLWLELSPDKAAGMRTVFLALGALLIATLPLLFLIPDTATERKRAAIRAEQDRIEEERAAAREQIVATASAQSDRTASGAEA